MRKRIRKIFHPVAIGIESCLRMFPHRTCTSPIVILGPPRSGTTLVYQAISAAFDVSYFSNYAEAHEKWPILSTILKRPEIRGYSPDFESKYGTTQGSSGPSEGREIWSTWFGYDVCDETISSKSILRCRSTVNAISGILGAPFVTKNPDHCLRVRALNLAFPEAIYIRVNRDIVETARSLLNARKKLLGSYEKWFAIRPPEIPFHNDLPVWEQVVRQVDFLEARLDRDFAEIIDPNRVLSVDYHDFCGDPSSYLKSIESLAMRQGVKLERRIDGLDPFHTSRGRSLSEEFERGILMSAREVGY